MADLAKVSRFLRRLGLTFLLSGLTFFFIALFNPDVALILWLPSWIALFVFWPELQHKLNRPIFGGRKPGPTRPTAWGRVIVTGLVALAVSFATALLPVDDLVVILSGPLIWIALYYAWPALSRRLPIPESWRVKAEPDAASPVLRRTVWQLLGRGALATVGVIAATILLMAMTTLAALGHGIVLARRVHDSIRVGMSVPEVLEASMDGEPPTRPLCFGASSDFPYDKNAAGDNIPAMNLQKDQGGTYWTYDRATNRSIAMTEAETVERLHVKLHDGYRWRFGYTYITMTPMHLSFSVVFGPDGRVSQVTPVHGWD